MNQYTVNPLTGRPILINGTTFNRLIIEAYDFLGGRLVRRATAPPLRDYSESYLNIVTGRMVRHGTRVYQQLIDGGRFEIVADEYLIPSELVDAAYTVLSQPNPNMSYEHLRELTNFGPDYLLDYSMIGPDYARARLRRDNRASREHRAQQMDRLGELGLALCNECQMPINVGKELCEECQT